MVCRYGGSMFSSSGVAAGSQVGGVGSYRQVSLVGWYLVVDSEVMRFDSSMLPANFVCYGLNPGLPDQEDGYQEMTSSVTQSP